MEDRLEHNSGIHLHSSDMCFEAIYLDKYSQGHIIFTQTLQLDITFLEGLQSMQSNKCVQK